jgi:hypothetical protein
MYATVWVALRISTTEPPPVTVADIAVGPKLKFVESGN